MTSPVFIQRRALDPWHRLLTIGVTSHITACRLVSIDATSPVTLTATRPGPQLLCPACARDLDCKLARGAEVGPYAREVGVLAELAPRTVTPRMRPGAARARTSTEEREWGCDAVPEVALYDLTSRGVMR
jgi:hypothetical protein